MNYYIFAGALVLMLIGMVGVIIPAVPGIPLMAIVAILFSIFVETLPTWALVVLVLITILSILIDQLSGVLGSKYAGANLKSMLLGFIGMLIGLFGFGPLGSIIGLFLGILLGELVFNKNARLAVKRAGAGAISVMAGIAINFGLAILFITVFIIGFFQ